MSEGTAEVAEQEEDKASATKRKMLTLVQRIRVVDYLRSLVEPIVADSNAAIAALVSIGSGVEINWQQLKYMIDDLEELKLGSKVHVKSLLTTEDDRVAALEARVEALSHSLGKLTDLFVKLTDRVFHIEAKLSP